MKFKNPFEHILSKANNAARGGTESLAGHSSEQATGWETLAELNPDSNETTFDDLAEVPFAGDTSVTDVSVTPEESVNSFSTGALDTDVVGISEQYGEAPSPELRALKKFFKADLRIKREIMDSAPQLADEYNEDSRARYIENAYRTFKGFHSDFAQFNREFQFDPAISDATDAFFQRGAEHFAPTSYSAGITEKIYRKEFTEMRPDFIEKVKKECVGYAFNDGLRPLVAESRTIDELLHAYHSYIMNNDEILRAVPIIDEKTNSQDYKISLRGDKSELSRAAFDALPKELDIGDTEIIGADNHVMMMVRDRGHALTISAEPDEKDPEKIWVEYNIPKICNTAMIEALPGIDHWSKNGARGRMLVAKSEFAPKLTDFIERVPTDDDLFRPGGTFYRPPDS